VLQSRDGSLWVGTDKGLVRRAPNQHGFSLVSLISQTGSVVQASVQSLFEDTRGQLWVGTRRHGAFVIDTLSSNVRPVLETENGTSSFSSAWVVAITQANDGQIWLGTVGQGIVRIDTATGQTRRHRHDASLPTSLAHDNIWSLLRDRSGLIWVGTLDGLDRNAPESSAILTVFGGTSRNDSISSHDVASVMQAKDGRVWLGFGGNGGVDILDPAGTRVASLLSADGHPENRLPKAGIPAMLESATGEVWLGTMAGLYRTNSTGTSEERINWPQREATQANYALLSEEHKLWVGRQG